MGNYIALHGDGVIPGGEFQFGGGGFCWYSININNHQQTYGVVMVALRALLDFMGAHHEFGMATFKIYDGNNQVGQGVFGPE